MGAEVEQFAEGAIQIYADMFVQTRKCSGWLSFHLHDWKHERSTTLNDDLQDMNQTTFISDNVMNGP